MFMDRSMISKLVDSAYTAVSVIQDGSTIAIGGFGGESIMRITNSKLYMTCYVIANNKFGVNYTGAFSHLWNSINGKRPGYAWADNPWVFAIEFKRIEP